MWLPAHAHCDSCQCLCMSSSLSIFSFFYKCTPDLDQAPVTTRGMQGIVGRAWASFRKFITCTSLTLNPMSMSRSSGNWHTHAHLEDWRDARCNLTELDQYPICMYTYMDPWQKHAWTQVLALRPSCQTQGMLRASRNPIWLDVMYFAEDNRALLLHCASLWLCARINVDLATTFMFRRVEYFLEVEVDRVRDWEKAKIFWSFVNCQ